MQNIYLHESYKLVHPVRDQRLIVLQRSGRENASGRVFKGDEYFLARASESDTESGLAWECSMRGEIG